MAHACSHLARRKAQHPGDLRDQVLAALGMGRRAGEVDVGPRDDEAGLDLVEPDGHPQDTLVDRSILRTGVAEMDLQRRDTPVRQVPQHVAADGDNRLVEMAAARRNPVVDAVSEREVRAKTVKIDCSAARVAELPGDEVLQGLAQRRGLPGQALDDAVLRPAVFGAHQQADMATARLFGGALQHDQAIGKRHQVVRRQGLEVDIEPGADCGR